MSLFCHQLIAQKLIWQREYYDDLQKKPKTIWQINSGPKGVMQGRYSQFYPNGVVKAEGMYQNGLQSGLWKFYHENGLPKVECQYFKGRMNGAYKSYDSDGRIAKEGQMANGIPVGLWKEFYGSGQPKSTGHYQNGNPSGLWTSYFEEGVVKATTNYLGKEKAIFKEFYESGTLKMEGLLVNNASDSIWNYYHPNGKLKARGKEKKGLKAGDWTYFFEDGTKESEGAYFNGEPMGSWKYYHNNGVLASAGNYINGLKEGQWKLFFSSGALQGEGFFAQGDGPYQEFYESGKLKVKGRVIKGNYSGTWLFFDETGFKEGNCDYADGLGTYTGFYENGRVKMTGQLKNAEKIGTWKLYDLKGDLIGTYKSYSDALKTPLPGIPKDTAKKVTTFNDPRFIKNRSYYFLPRSYEISRLNVSFNPLAPFLNQLPIYLEYIIPNRTGINAGFVYYREPIFGNFEKPLVNATYKEGYSIDLSPRFYTRDKGNGMLFFSPALRFKSIKYLYNELTSAPSAVPRLYRGDEQNYDFTLNFGFKALKPLVNYNFISFELFLGCGLGYKNQNLIRERDVFSDISSNNGLYLPLRFGGSIGYCF